MRALQPLTLILPAAHPPKLIEVLWIAACAAVRATVGKLLTLIYPDGNKRPALERENSKHMVHVASAESWHPPPWRQPVPAHVRQPGAIQLCPN
ncbi:MAG TPA: hypothetical protein VL178_00865 [Pseudomonas sp.]|jgi:hypothetical protein|nr:hypothetical protein [Pseudomonas sp.]